MHSAEYHEAFNKALSGIVSGGLEEIVDTVEEILKVEGLTIKEIKDRMYNVLVYIAAIQDALDGSSTSDRVCQRVFELIHQIEKSWG